MTSFITTSLKANSLDVITAQSIAEEHCLTFIKRNNHSVENLLKDNGSDGFFIVKNNQLALVNNSKEELFFHPGTGLIRTKLLERKDNDLLIEALGIRPEDSVLDCTGGLCNDSIVISYYLEHGELTTFEKTKELFMISKYGLLQYTKGSKKLKNAFRKIKLYNIDYNSFFSNQYLLPSNKIKKFDSIYFDPMFANPVVESPGISKIREYASYDVLSKSTIEKALDVATKRVVVKIRNNDKDFVKKMNPQEIIGNSKNKIRYAIFEKELYG